MNIRVTLGQKKEGLGLRFLERLVRQKGSKTISVVKRRKKRRIQERESVK